jgi:hypothetical protein
MAKIAGSADPDPHHNVMDPDTEVRFLWVVSLCQQTVRRVADSEVLM